MFNIFRLNYRENIFIDWLLEVLFFPLWWYSLGFWQICRFALAFLRRREQQIGFLVWLKNIFVPMYGQTDLVSRLVSFLVRSTQVVVRGVFLLIFVVIAIFFVMAWLGLPILAVYEILYNLNVKNL